MVDNVVKVLVAVAVVLILMNIYVMRADEITYVTTLLYMDDPVGDEDGPGGYVYPLANDFRMVSKVFDLTRFEVEADDKNMYFRIYFENLGGNPWNGLAGFSYQYVHIYVKTTLNITLRNDTFGLNVIVDPGWHFAILLNGGWSTIQAPVPQGEFPGIWLSEGTPRPIIPGKELYVVPRENVIILNISKTDLLDTANYDKWLFAVFVTSYDGYNSSRVRAVTVAPGPWTIGGGDPDAIAAGVQPQVLDLLCASIDEQYSILKTYNITSGMPAVAPMIELNKMEVTRTITLPEPETTTPTTTQPSPYVPPTTSPQRTSPTQEKGSASSSDQSEGQVGPSLEMVIIVISAIIAAFIILGIFARDMLRRPR